MVRLIDADALKEHAKVAHLRTVNQYGASEYFDETVISAGWIDCAPTIDAEPHWIPCSERLPENMEPVNITWINRDPEPYYMHIKDKPFTATGIYYKDKWYWWSSTCDEILCEIDEVDDGIEIVAWMPLPKPYEVDKE
jgi:hypothetical protein